METLRAELVVEKLGELEPDDSGFYVILSNIYAQAGKWEGVTRMRRLVIANGVKKSVTCSWIEVGNGFHAFLSRDTSQYPDSNAIYTELERIGALRAESGYIPSTASVFHDVKDYKKTGIVCSHIERPAIAFGLISMDSGTPLLTRKNLRMCEDCHVAVKFISRITERESRSETSTLSPLLDGECSCGESGDCW